VASDSGSWSAAGYQERASDGTWWHEPAPVAPVGQAADAGWGNIRAAVLYRLQRLSFNHAMLAADPPQGRVPGPHALALLYAAADPRSTPERPSYVVGAATRVVADTDDVRPGRNVRDVSRFLHAIVDIANQRYRDGGFDPRSLTDRDEKNMPAGAEFVGVGVSSLGMPGQDWSKARSEAGFGLRMPSRSDVRLVDGTWLEMWRESGASTTYARCNRLLDYTPGLVVSRMIPADYMPPHDSGHQWLDRLLSIVDAAYQSNRRHRGGR